MKEDAVGRGDELEAAWRDVVARFPDCSTLTDGCQSCVPKDDGFRSACDCTRPKSSWSS